MSSLPDVRYISTHVVRPVTQTEPHQSGMLDLTHWDLMNLPFIYIQRGLLFHKPHIQVSHLMESLSRTLDYFLPLTGRIATKSHQEDDTISYYIDCSNVVGAQFIHATADITVADVVDPLYVPETVHSLFPLNGVMNYQGVSQPLLGVQVTELVDGIFVGCSINHLVADGISFWHFMKSWSDISRALLLDQNSPVPQPLLPIFKRWCSSDTDFPTRFPSSIVNKLALRISPPPLSQRTFHFSAQKLAQLKIQANAEQETDQISSFQALLGHAWITITRARRLDPSQQTTHRLAINNRTRLSPALPEEYFGNLSTVVSAAAKVEELLQKGVGWAAWLLNQAIKAHVDSEIRSRWERWVKKPFLFIPTEVETTPTDLITGDSPRFDMYGNDFGWGRPITVRSGHPHVSSDGLILALPGAVEGSIDLEVSLLPQVLKATGDLTDLTKTISI